MKPVHLDPTTFRRELLRTAAINVGGIVANPAATGVKDEVVVAIALRISKALMEACGFVEREEPVEECEDCAKVVPDNVIGATHCRAHSQPATCQVISTMLTSMPPKPGPKCGLPLPCKLHDKNEVANTIAALNKISDEYLEQSRRNHP